MSQMGNSLMGQLLAGLSMVWWQVPHEPRIACRCVAQAEGMEGASMGWWLGPAADDAQSILSQLIGSAIGSEL